MQTKQFSEQTHYLTGVPKCPVCLTSADVYRRRDTNDFEGWCEVCGDLKITLAAAEKARADGLAHLLSRWLMTNPDHTTLIDVPQLEAILKEAPSYSVLEKLDLALGQMAKMTQQPGQFTQFDYTKHYPLIYATSPEEAQFYVHELDSLKYVNKGASIRSAIVTARGYERLQEIRGSGRQSESAFVAMWFDDCMEDLYKPAIVEAGYKAVRMKEHVHLNRIDDEIIAQIRKSRFMVADFTGQRGGVYFEAGYMLGQNRNVFWMCDKSQLKDLHFDTRQYNFIDYSGFEDAKTRLHFRILAIEGEGPFIMGH
jgi:hypothetical protein